MTGSLLALYRIELRRLLTPVMIALPFLLLVLSSVIVLLFTQHRSVVDLPRLIIELVGNVCIVFGVPIAAVGMVAADLKDHWLRTLLMRPVARAEYLLARILAVYTLVAVIILIAGILPTFILPVFLNKPIIWMWSRSLPTLGFLFGHAFLILMLLTLLSCWLPGVANVMLLAGWAMTSALLGGYVRSQFWDVGPIVVATEFFFPSGFLDAAMMAQQHTGDPLSSALWGVASTVAVMSLSFWSVNRVQLDGGSE
jgi:hypothetical protein